MVSNATLAFNQSVLQLDKYRASGDAVADGWVAEHLGNASPELVRELFQSLADSAVPIPEALRPASDAFLAQITLPSWAKPTEMAAGAAFFRRLWYNVQVMLGCYSLPYCYLAKDGVKVLYMSKRLRTDASKRLQETDDFLLRMMLPNAFSNPQTFQVIAKIRLLHAINRYYIFKHGNWDVATMGYPINHEDMAGTNLAFSYIVLRGLRKIKVGFSQEEGQAFLHLWNVIGYMLGVPEELLPNNIHEAQMIDDAIARRQFTGSEEGKELTKVLLESISNNVPKDQAKFIPGYIKYLLGEEKAKLLGMEQVGSIEPYLSILLLQNRVNSALGKDFSKKPVSQPIGAFAW